MPEAEQHFVHRVAWLRAAVLGANDGVISTASLVVGVAAAAAGRGRDPHCRFRRLGGRRDVDGGGGIRLGQLASRFGIRRP